MLGLTKARVGSLLLCVEHQADVDERNLFELTHPDFPGEIAGPDQLVGRS